MFRYLYMYLKKYMLLNNKKLGYTLTEILVALLIFSIVMSIIVVVIQVPTRTSNYLGFETNATRELKSATDKIISILLYSKNATASDILNNSISNYYIYNKDNNLYYNYYDTDTDSTKDILLAENINISATVNYINSPNILPKKYVEIQLTYNHPKIQKNYNLTIPLMNSFTINTSSISTGSYLYIEFSN